MIFSVGYIECCWINRWLVLLSQKEFLMNTGE